MAASSPASGFRAAFLAEKVVDHAHRPPEAAASSFYLGTAAASRGKKSTESQNDELDVFGAEKYFGLDMDGDDDDQTAAVAPEIPLGSSRVKEANYAYRGRPPSAQSTSSPGAGGSALLGRDGQKAPPAAATSRKPACRSAGGGKMFVNVFRCSCSGGASDVVVNEVAGGGDGGVENSAARWGIAHRQLLQPELYCREKATSRPAGNLGASGKTSDEKRKDHRVSALVGKEAEAELGLGRRRNDAAAMAAEDDDAAAAGSDDSSSDLFEIDSVSTSTALLGVSGTTSISTTCSAPSEASIAWSVVTASAANFSVASDDGEQSPSGPETARLHRRPGAAMLLGCGSGKAVGISSNTQRLPKMAKAAEWPLYGRPTPAAATELRYRPDRPALVDIMQAQARRAVAESRSRYIKK